MNSKEYLINKLKELHAKLSLSFRLEYDDFDYSHTIEVKPMRAYYHDKKYIEAEQKLVLDFIKKYPYELLGFYNKRSWYKITNPCFSIGDAFEKTPRVKKIELKNINYEEYIEEYNKLISTPILEKSKFNNELILKDNNRVSYLEVSQKNNIKPRNITTSFQKLNSNFQELNSKAA